MNKILKIIFSVFLFVSLIVGEITPFQNSISTETITNSNKYSSNNDSSNNNDSIIGSKDNNEDIGKGSSNSSIYNNEDQGGLSNIYKIIIGVSVGVGGLILILATVFIVCKSLKKRHIVDRKSKVFGGYDYFKKK